MPAIRLTRDGPLTTVSPGALERLALYAGERCEALSIVAQTLEDAALLKDVQATLDFAANLYHGVTGRTLPMAEVGHDDEKGLNHGEHGGHGGCKANRSTALGPTTGATTATHHRQV